MIEIEKVIFNKEKYIYDMKLVSSFKEDIKMVKNILEQHDLLL